MAQSSCENCGGTGYQEQYRKPIICSTCEGTGKLGRPDNRFASVRDGRVEWQWYHYAALVFFWVFLGLQYFLFFPRLFGW